MQQRKEETPFENINTCSWPWTVDLINLVTLILSTTTDTPWATDTTCTSSKWHKKKHQQEKHPPWLTGKTSGHTSPTHRKTNGSMSTELSTELCRVFTTMKGSNFYGALQQNIRKNTNNLPEFVQEQLLYNKERTLDYLIYLTLSGWVEILDSSC